jgi:hypothetical protein
VDLEDLPSGACSVGTAAHRHVTDGVWASRAVVARLSRA